MVHRCSCTRRGWAAGGRRAWLQLSAAPAGAGPGRGKGKSSGDPAAFPLGYVVVSMDTEAQPAQHTCGAGQRDTSSLARRSLAVAHPIKPFIDRWYAAFTTDWRGTYCAAAMALEAAMLHCTPANSF